MTDIRRSFANRLNRQLFEKAISAGKLAQLSGIADSTISRILACKSSPSLDVLHSICQGLAITEAELFADNITKGQSERDRRLLIYFHRLTEEQQNYHLDFLEYETRPQISKRI